MKKSLMRIMLVISVFYAGFCAAGQGRHTPYLSVYNQWDQEIRVQEGLLWKTDAVLLPNQSKSWLMWLSGHTFSLAISYKNANGTWVPVPGCSDGHYSSTLKVFVYGSSGNPSIPRCRSEAFS